MASDSTALTLIHQLPAYLVPSVHFWVQQGPSEWRKVTVVSGDPPGAVPTNAAYGYWIVYAQAGGQPTASLKTLDPSGTFICGIGTWMLGLSSGPSEGSGASSFTLTNQLPDTLAASAEFSIKQGTGEPAKVIVDSGKSATFPTEPSRGPWTVIVKVGDKTSSSVTTSDPGATFSCDVSAWTPELASGPASGVSRPPGSPGGSVDPIEAQTSARDLEGLKQSADALATRWRGGDAAALPALRRVADALGSADLGDHAAQLAAADRLASLALERAELLSAEDEVALVHRLADAPLPSESPAEWTAKRLQKVAFALHALGRLQRAVRHDVDFSDLPALAVAPPVEAGLPPGAPPEAIRDPALRARYVEAIEENRRRAETYREQRRLHTLLARFTGQVDRLLASLYAPPAPAVAETPALPPIQPLVEPLDDFPGRRRDVFGLGEILHLTHAVEPALSPAQVRPLRWFVASGGGAFEDNRDGEATFRAPTTPGVARLALRVTSGPDDGRTVATVEVGVNAPISAAMTQKPLTGQRHVQGAYSVGFKGLITLSPNVSYAGVQFREGTVVSVATGWLLSQNGLVHAIGAACTITGNQVNGVDTVYTGQSSPPPPYAPGAFLWAIPWQYSTDGGTTWTTFTTASHSSASAAVGVVDGSATISKAGAGPFTALASDATTNY